MVLVAERLLPGEVGRKIRDVLLAEGCGHARHDGVLALARLVGVETVPQVVLVLTGKQRRFLRGLGHELKVVVQVGKGGIDTGLIAAVDQALTDHELVKIKVAENADLDRHEAADAIAQQTKSEVAQVLGNTVLLYRADPDEPKIALP